MPQMTGVQLAETVRADRPGLAIILSTGYAELPSEMGTSLTGLRKPFSQKDLAEAVAKAIGSV